MKKTHRETARFALMENSGREEEPTGPGAAPTCAIVTLCGQCVTIVACEYEQRVVVVAVLAAVVVIATDLRFVRRQKETTYCTATGSCIFHRKFS